MISLQGFSRQLAAAVALEHPYQGRGFRLPPPTQGRPASVLMLFALSQKKHEPMLLFIERSNSVDEHKGQIAFPGGMIEPGETSEDAALREFEEELGLALPNVQMFGSLPELPTFTTGFRVTPFVALHDIKAEGLPLQASSDEVASFFWLGWPELLKPESYRFETFRSGDVDYPTPVFEVDGHRIWGATAAMVLNLKERFERVSAK